MKKEKRKRIKITEVIVYILQQVFLRTVGSWGAFVIDENGNFKYEHDKTPLIVAHDNKVEYTKENIHTY